MAGLRRAELELMSTNLTNAVTKKLGTPEAKLAYIEILVVLAVLLNLLMVILGKLRPRCKSGFLKGVSWLIFTLSPYLVAYTLGLMQDAPFRSGFFSYWPVFLVFTLGSPDSFSAYVIEDHEQRKRFASQVIIKLLVLILLMALNIYPSKSFLGFAPFVLWLAVYVKLLGRLVSLTGASRNIIEIIHKFNMDYLTSDRILSTLRDADPLTMKGYNLLVSWKGFSLWRLLRTDQAVPPAYTKQFDAPGDWVLSLEDVWNCEGRLLSSRQGGCDPDGRLKDMLLSLSLFRLLISMYAEYTLPAEVPNKTWDLIQNGVLGNYRRAFHVIEVELALAFDFFYTDYPFLGSLMGVLRLTGSCILSVMSIALVAHLSHTIVIPEETVRMPTMLGLGVNKLVTYVVVAAFLATETMQLALLFFSRWFKIMFLLIYVSKAGSCRGIQWLDDIVGMICSKIPPLKPWERKLHQYSLLESYDFSPSVISSFVRLILFMDQVRLGQKEGRAIRLSEEVKEAVFDSLRRNGRNLRNGEASLRTNDVSNKLAWACSLETQTHVVMVWHIATIFCEHYRKPPEDTAGGCGKDFLVATSLSAYLAYLVVFAPRLLPGHPNITRHLFGHVILEARKVFRGCRTNGERLARLNQIAGQPDDTIVNRGARLGKTILDEVGEPRRIWKLLAEFWVETMLYVSPSDDFKAHLEELADGGQFVTHLWALLRHTGVERDKEGTQAAVNKTRAPETPKNASIDGDTTPIGSTTTREMAMDVGLGEKELEEIKTVTGDA